MFLTLLLIFFEIITGPQSYLTHIINRAREKAGPCEHTVTENPLTGIKVRWRALIWYKLCQNRSTGSKVISILQNFVGRPQDSTRDCPQIVVPNQWEECSAISFSIIYNILQKISRIFYGRRKLKIFAGNELILETKLYCTKICFAPHSPFNKEL